jgi:diguanylate cyclase (GGDEF)-like protein
MTVVLIAAAAALALILLALGLVLIGRRTTRAADERISAAVADLNDRMESIVRELKQTVVEAEAETERARSFAELAGSLDLDDVLARTLESAAAAVGADAALVSLERGPGEKRLVTTLGLSAEEAERQGVVAGPPDGRAARAVTMTYSYGPDETAADGGLIRAGLIVPLAIEKVPHGHIAVFTRSSGHTFGDEEMSALEGLASRAGPAIENARRFREARRLADLDALTGLHNRRYFYETLGREIARAHRYNRQLALIVIDLDDFKAINDRIGHLAGDAVLSDAADRIRDAVRTADIACRVGGDEFAIILPESTLSDADQLHGRIQQAVSGRPLNGIGAISLSAGIADLRPDDDSTSFFQRADDALYRAKERGKSQVAAWGETAAPPGSPPAGR